MDTDVVVIGGGSAGLQAALSLGRMRFDVVVVDAGKPSNAPAHAIGGLLGARDGAPLDVLATGRAQLADLPSVRLVDGEATRVDADRSVAAPTTPRDAAFSHLALERTDAGQLATDAFGRTSAAGVYAAGDLVATAPAVVQALATGQRAAVAVARDLSSATP